MTMLFKRRLNNCSGGSRSKYASYKVFIIYTSFWIIQLSLKEYDTSCKITGGRLVMYSLIFMRT